MIKNILFIVILTIVQSATEKKKETEKSELNQTHIISKTSFQPFLASFFLETPTIDSHFIRNCDLDSFTKFIRKNHEYEHRESIILMSLSNYMESESYIIHPKHRSMYYSSPSLAESGPLSAEEIKPLVKHIANALKFIHSKGMVHMDIRPSNIFRKFQSSAYGAIPSLNQYVLGGFGFAMSWGDMDPLMVQNYIDEFASPEIRFLKAAPHMSLLATIGDAFLVFGQAADLFSFGLTIAALRVGYCSAMKNWNLFRNNLMAEIYPEEFENDFIEVLKFLLNKSPDERNMSKLLTLPYFQEAYQTSEKTCRVM